MNISVYHGTSVQSCAEFSKFSQVTDRNKKSKPATAQLAITTNSARSHHAALLIRFAKKKWKLVLANAIVTNMHVMLTV